MSTMSSTTSSVERFLDGVIISSPDGVDKSTAESSLLEEPSGANPPCSNKEFQSFHTFKMLLTMVKEQTKEKPNRCREIVLYQPPVHVVLLAKLGLDLAVERTEGTAMWGRRRWATHASTIHLNFKLPEGFSDVEMMPKGDGTLWNACRYSFLDRLRGWMVTQKQRDNGVKDKFYKHRASGTKCRSTTEVVKFLLREEDPNKAKTQRTESGEKARRTRSVLAKKRKRDSLDINGESCEAVLERNASASSAELMEQGRKSLFEPRDKGLKMGLDGEAEEEVSKELVFDSSLHEEKMNCEGATDPLEAACTSGGVAPNLPSAAEAVQAIEVVEAAPSNLKANEMESGEISIYDIPFGEIEIRL